MFVSQVRDYLLGEKIGEGTFGKVRLAKHIPTNEIVAMKILDKQKYTISEKTKIRLMREMKILQQLNHPNLIQLYEIFENEQNWYLVMEYVDGGEFHFLIEKIKHLAKHVQMFADDLILIMEGPISEIDKKLINIFKIIQEFGMNPNTEKTLKSKTLSKIKYLGIWLEKEKHLKKNFEKVKDSFKKIKKIFSQQKLANGVKLQMFKSICISQLFYGLVIFNLNQKDFDSIDVWINKKVTKFLKINPHSPRIIYKTEAKLDQARISIYKRRYKLKKKLEILGFDHISQKLKFSKKKDENINWEIENLKLLNVNLNDFRQKLIINSSGWKGQEYLKIIKYNNNINKQQKYLKWIGSTSILKLRNFTNYLNRYSYVYDKNKLKTKFCNLCKKHLNQEIIEDIDHFLWDCPFYGKNRKIWINELIQINKNKQLKNNILDIIRNKDSLFILSLVNDKENYDSLLKFLNKNLEIRAVRGN
ncbi:protein kinase [Anaeramoeba flamelloides]|uniref:Protein kinase n=1 Tax=Anaeramoeba flamelloides TaxID=1746091 RepID=A0ABQ8X8V7_9EUKA|nr:protein kinase [Anaeramoeba flamelloides]